MFRSCLVAPLVCWSAFSQSSDTGGFRGQVTDASGGVVSGVSVVAANSDTGLERRATTDSQGQYAIAGLPLTALTRSGSRGRASAPNRPVHCS